MTALVLAALLAGAAPAAAGASAGGAPIADLPLVEVPARGEGTLLALLVTGDGGWVAIDEQLAAELSRAGVAVVGLDALRYFWRRRSMDETVRDVARVLDHYRAAWGRSEVILVGYSRGADVVPFLAPRLPERLRGAVRLVAALGPSTFAELEVHVVDLFSSRRRADALATEPAARATVALAPFLCVQGADERDSLCPQVADLPRVTRVVLPGGHHFDRDYPRLARLILDAVARPP